MHLARHKQARIEGFGPVGSYLHQEFDRTNVWDAGRGSGWHDRPKTG
jgi:hypothetical protein